MNTLKILTQKKYITIVILTLLTSLIIMTPVLAQSLANSSSWSFVMAYNIAEIWGTTRHQMDAGKMTLSGKLETTAIYGGPKPTNSTFKIEVWEDISLWPDKKICTIKDIKTPPTWGATQPFSLSCGTVTKGKYYLHIVRSALDDFEVKGTGTLTTK